MAIWSFSGRYLAEAWGRLTDGESFGLVVKNLFQTQELTYALIPLAMGIIAARIFRVRIPLTVWLPFSAATLYLLGIVLVYLGTPYELELASEYELRSDGSSDLRHAFGSDLSGTGCDGRCPRIGSGRTRAFHV